jgi:hypothetical protein
MDVTNDSVKCNKELFSTAMTSAGSSGSCLVQKKDEPDSAIENSSQDDASKRATGRMSEVIDITTFLKEGGHLPDCQNLWHLSDVF